MRYISIILLLIGFCLFACRPTPLEIELPEYEDQIVVISQVVPNALMTVALTKTISALDFSEEEGDTLNQSLFDDILVEDAIISISYREVTDTLFQLASGVYASVGTPTYVNEKYSLKIEVEDKVLTSENTMLPVVEFAEATPVIEISDEDTLVQFDFKIIDEPGDNWYMLNFYARERTEGGFDLNSFFQNDGNVLKRTELLSDEFFEDGEFEASIDLPNIAPTDSIAVTLSNINEDYFEYLQIRQSSSNFFTELTKEPVSLPTNIQGGLGFFNTHFPDLRLYDLNEF